jgi:5-(carboxyamino)imidazole ribonucleotide mutase
MAIGKAGARNAGILATQMLALHDAELTRRLVEFKAEMAIGVEAKAKVLKQRLEKDFPASP